MRCASDASVVTCFFAKRGDATRRSATLRAWLVAALGVIALVIATHAAEARGAPARTVPAAGVLAWPAVAVRAEPHAKARRVTLLRQFRRDFRPQIVLAIGARRDADSRLWYKLNLPIRPYGTTGWAPAEAFELGPIDERIVIHRDARVLDFYRGSRLLLRTRIAVGRPDRPTPLGSFYVTSKFRPSPDTPILGKYAFELSAPAQLTDFPGGGVIGIHGTYQPWLLGQAVSSGCVRVSNAAILKLKRLVPLGTPVRIVRS